MIFARDKSQMCNNLLQYAHVYAWGREHGRKVISMRFSYKYQYFRICHTPLTGFGWYLFAKYLSALGLMPTANFKRAECNHEALERKMLRHKHIVVSGWHVRFYDLFLKYRSEICDLFTIDDLYTNPVREKMLQVEGGDNNVVRLGVHIRRGDYAQWKDGIYCYDDETYARYINRFAALHDGEDIHVFLSTNDPDVVEEKYQEMCPNVHIHYLRGNSPQDLFMLSECDYVIGPPSTFSLVAIMYRDIPLYRMDTSDETVSLKDNFHLFDYWFKRII